MTNRYSFLPSRQLPNTEQLEAMPTLLQAHTCDMKFNDGEVRLFLSRCDSRDGEPFDNTVYLEIYDGRNWVDQGYYDGDNPIDCMPGVTGTYFTDFKVDADRAIELLNEETRRCENCGYKLDDGYKTHETICGACVSAQDQDRLALQALLNSIVRGNG